MPVWVSWWNVSPREDGFPPGSALGKTILIHTGMAYLYNGALSMDNVQGRLIKIVSGQMFMVHIVK